MKTPNFKAPSLRRLNLRDLNLRDRVPRPQDWRLRRPTFRIPSIDELRTRASEVSPETLLSLGIVAAAMLFVFLQLQPSLLFANTTPAGGDMGAHVWGPDYMRHHLLPNLRLTGWAPDWYAGFPAYHFYFPLPAFMIVVLDFLLPYGVAFKLITVLGLVTLPLCAYAFGRLAGMRFPGPVMLSLATLPFLFDRGFTIYGGNIPSTLAGEFAFSISLSFALLFLGVVARGLDTGRNRALGAVLLALTGLSHLLPTIFAVVGALVLLLLRPGRARLKFLLGLIGVGALLAAFWSFPFGMRLQYANNMGWEKITQYSENLFPQNKTWLWLVLAPAGALCAVALRRRVGLFLLGMAAISGTLFVVAPASRLWNARVLPFWFLSLYLLAGVAVAEMGPAVGRLLATDPDRPPPFARWVTPIAASLAVWMFVGLPLGVLPNWIPKPATTDTSYVDDWAKWNYSGYERKPAYQEYKSVIDMMADVGRSHGCGRTHWEYESQQDRFGTPMALMLLPFWTDGCIGSMEGLYFESSATVPYHFMNAAELSKAPSNPQRDLPYNSLDVARGIEHLKMMGTRYYLAFSPEATAQADVHPDLTLVGVTGAWKAYEVRGSEIVSPLGFQPAVITGGGKGEREWMAVMTDWYQGFTGGDDVFLAASGPREWERVEVNDVVPDDPTVKTVGARVEVEPAARLPLDPIQVSGIRTSDNRITFDVDRIGVPVLVKASYFPNWKVAGASGPYRVSPNLMVVIPDAQHVSLYYGRTPVDYMGYLLSIIGIGLAVAWWRRGPVDVDDPVPDDDVDGSRRGVRRRTGARRSDAAWVGATRRHPGQTGARPGIRPGWLRLRSPPGPSRVAPPAGPARVRPDTRGDRRRPRRPPVGPEPRRPRARSFPAGAGGRRGLHRLRPTSVGRGRGRGARRRRRGGGPLRHRVPDVARRGPHRQHRPPAPG